MSHSAHNIHIILSEDKTAKYLQLFGHLYFLFSSSNFTIYWPQLTQIFIVIFKQNIDYWHTFWIDA